MPKKIAVIGCGAAGAAAAIQLRNTAVKYAIKADVTVFEHNPEILKKLSATGNGRCNFSNEKISEKNYRSVSGSKSELKEILSSRFSDDKEFFLSLGVMSCTENGRIYPRSEQSKTIKDALTRALSELNVKTVTGCKIESFYEANGFFYVNSEKFDAVIVAAGGKASPTHGSDGSSYDILKSFGHSVTKLYPALTGLSPENSLRNIKGARLKGTASLYSDSVLLGSEYGEIQFTESAISGIPVMNLSSFCSGNKNLSLVIDACAEMSEAEIIGFIKAQTVLYPLSDTETLLQGITHRLIGYEVLKQSGVSPHTPQHSLSFADIEKIAHSLKSLKFPISSVRGFEYAQVTSGGVPLDEFDSDTLMSKKMPGLFAAGEALDADGECGGYNLHCAGLTGRIAGDAAARYVIKDS